MDISFQEEFNDEDRWAMQEAHKEALKALSKGEVPVGCVMVYQGKILASSHNKMEVMSSVIFHAELQCIQEAEKKLGSWRLDGCSMYVTLEPCLMCLGAIINARVSRVVCGLRENRRAQSLKMENLLKEAKNLAPSIEMKCGLMATAAHNLLKVFFKKRRQECKKI